MTTTTPARLAMVVVVAALVGGSVGCSATTRAEAPGMALVASREALIGAPAATASKLAPVCGNFMGTPSKGEVGGLVVILVLLSPIIIPVLILGAPLWLLGKVSR